MHRAGVIAAVQAKGGGTRAVFPTFLHLHSFPPKALYQPLIPLYKWWHLSLRKYVIYYLRIQSLIKGQLGRAQSDV